MIYLKKIKYLCEEKGYLSSIDYQRFKYFKIRRSFFINFKKKNATRGKHAHRKCSQFIVCTSGKILVNSIDKKNIKKKFLLSKADQGLYIKPLVWVELTALVKNSTAACLANRKYEPDDYIYRLEELKDFK
jgi:dTDP-4-dehydrorhamnose 3,5-epimerase-like enzyme